MFWLLKIDASTLDLKERVVAINRVSKTVKGGRIFKFAALVVVGDGNGIVGFGIGKSAKFRTRSARALKTLRRTCRRLLCAAPPSRTRSSANSAQAVFS